MFLHVESVAVTKHLLILKDLFFACFFTLLVLKRVRFERRRASDEFFFADAPCRHVA